MIETPISFLQIDSPAPGSVVPPGRHALQGWLMPKLGGSFADLRVAMGDRRFPGLFGFPRVDLAAHFQTGRPSEPAGFQVNVELGPGPNRLTVEALQIEGVWQEVGAIDLTVDPARPPVDLPLPTAPVWGGEFGHLLHALLTEPTGTAQLDARADRLVATAPFPRDAMRPKAPFVGRLHTPEAIVAAPDGFVDVAGYLFHPAARVVRMSASTDLQVMQALRTGESTPDVADAHPRTAAAKACGFSGRIFVPAQLPSPVSLRLYAELADGSSHLVHVARVQVRPASELSRPFTVRTAAEIDAAVTALRRAIARHQLALVTNAAFDAELARLRTAVAAAPPRARSAPEIELESTFRHADAAQRQNAGLPADGLLIAGLATDAAPVVAAGLAQAVVVLRRRHPRLAPSVHLVMTGDGPWLDLPGVTRAARPLTEDDVMRLADLTVRTADRGAEGLPAGDTVALAEALAHRLHRRRAELSGTKAAP